MLWQISHVTSLTFWMCPVFQLLDSNDLSKLAVLLACHLLTKCEADLLFLCESIPHLLHLFDSWLYLPDLVFYVIEQPAKRSLWALTFLNILGSLHSIFFPWSQSSSHHAVSVWRWTRIISLRHCFLNGRKLPKFYFLIFCNAQFNHNVYFLLQIKHLPLI